MAQETWYLIERSIQLRGSVTQSSLPASRIQTGKRAGSANRSDCIVSLERLLFGMMNHSTLIVGLLVTRLVIAQVSVVTSRYDTFGTSANLRETPSAPTIGV